jgi:hypothetical protein
VITKDVLNVFDIAARSSLHLPTVCNKQLSAHLEIATEVATIIYMACHLSVEELHWYVFCMSYTQVCWHTFSTILTVNTSRFVTRLLSRKANEWENNSFSNSNKTFVTLHISNVYLTWTAMTKAAFNKEKAYQQN